MKKTESSTSGFLEVNTIGRYAVARLDQFGTGPMAADGTWEGKRTVSKHQIQPGCRKIVGWRGTEQPNLLRENMFSGANGDRGKPRAGFATILVDAQSTKYDDHTLTYIHTYINSPLMFRSIPILVASVGRERRTLTGSW